MNLLRACGALEAVTLADGRDTPTDVSGRAPRVGVLMIAFWPKNALAQRKFEKSKSKITNINISIHIRT